MIKKKLIIERNINKLKELPFIREAILKEKENRAEEVVRIIEKLKEKNPVDDISVSRMQRICGLGYPKAEAIFSKLLKMGIITQNNEGRYLISGSQEQMNDLRTGKNDDLPPEVCYEIIKSELNKAKMAAEVIRYGFYLFVTTDEVMDIRKTSEFFHADTSEILSIFNYLVEKGAIVPIEKPFYYDVLFDSEATKEILSHDLLLAGIRI